MSCVLCMHHTWSAKYICIQNMFNALTIHMAYRIYSQCTLHVFSMYSTEYILNVLSYNLHKDTLHVQGLQNAFSYTKICSILSTHLIYAHGLGAGGSARCARCTRAVNNLHHTGSQNATWLTTASLDPGHGIQILECMHVCVYVCVCVSVSVCVCVCVCV